MVVGRIDFVAEVMVGGGWGCGIVAWVVKDVGVWRRWRVGIDGMLHLIEQRLLPLFQLAKDVDVVL
jgi:hypothetical protein